MYKVSIITICYNQRDNIERTMRSALSQSYPNIEYIIVDGASTDGTQTVIERVLQDYPNHIVKYTSEKDNGIYDAMNKGVLRATGDWVIFMNGGDWFHASDSIESVFKNVDDDTVIAHGDIVWENQNYRYRVKPCSLDMMGIKMAVKHQATFTRLDYHKQHLFDTSYRSAGDYDFFYKAYFNDHVKFQYIPVVVSHFNGVGGESTSNKWNSYKENLRVRGLETNFWYKSLMTLKYLEVLCKLFVKKHFFSEKRNLAIAIARVKRHGGTEIIVNDEI